VEPAAEGLVREAARLATQAERISQSAQELAKDATSVLPPKEGTRLSSAIEHLAATARETQQELGRIGEELRRDVVRERPSGELSADEIKALFPLQSLPAVLSQQEALLRERSDSIARSNAAAFQQMNLSSILDALGREQKAAAKMARAVLRDLPELNELSTGQRRAVRRSLEILARQLRDKNVVEEWLSKQQPDLDAQRPIDVIRGGRAEVVEQLLTDALRGIPS